jgi:ribosome biogenesis GTPase A
MLDLGSETMLIQWYPGHMAKARRMLEDNLKLIDVVAELVDARAPRSTSNPDFNDILKGKKRIIILNKSDLADPAATKKWIARYEKQGIPAMPFVSTGGNKKAVVERIAASVQDEVKRMKEKGVLKTVRAMVVGIPNVGKSTFINRIAGAARAKAGDKPGVTKGKQWVKISPYLELMDTPGLLWPKLDHEVYAQRLAFIGSIKDDIMDVEALASLLLLHLRDKHYVDVSTRYKQIEQDMDPGLLLEAVCKSRSFIFPGGKWDTERAARIVLDEFRGGKIARATLDDPDVTE